MSETDTGATSDDAARRELLAELTGFQRDILVVLAAEGPEYGLGIKRSLEDHYGEVNHGRLYPNLDELSEHDYVEIGSRDKRTNEYALTDAGREAIAADVRWRENAVEGIVDAE